MTLSENIGFTTYDNCRLYIGTKFLLVNDVKEFIKQLKERLFREALERKKGLSDSSLDRLTLEGINDDINELAGDELI